MAFPKPFSSKALTIGGSEKVTSIFAADYDMSTLRSARPKGGVDPGHPKDYAINQINGGKTHRRNR